MAREDKIFQLAKGFRGRAKNCYRIAARRVEKALQHSYRSRRLKKRTAREAWIMQVRAAAMEHDLVYSKLIHGLQLANVGLDRRMLAILAQTEPYTFRALVDEAKGALRRSVIGEGNTPPAASDAGAAGGGTFKPSASRAASAAPSVAGMEGDGARDELAQAFSMKVQLSARSTASR